MNSFNFSYISLKLNGWDNFKHYLRSCYETHFKNAAWEGLVLIQSVFLLK